MDPLNSQKHAFRRRLISGILMGLSPEALRAFVTGYENDEHELRADLRDAA